MKRAVNLRLEESVIVTLNQLTEELHTTKTEVIERAISFFSKQNNLKHNQLSVSYTHLTLPTICSV